MNKTQFEFPISIYGQAEPISEVLTKQRCRIFYKGCNRNGTYISDEFANELISTLAYVPIKGIYEYPDYTDHGENRSDGRIYGIVPQDFNFAWEPHLDKDGVERLYACCDVYLFTALYPEANQISGKGQSMELFPPSLQYHSIVIHGQKYIQFDHGRFLGLQVLGEDVEPCFEGASFYSLQQSINDTIQKIKEFSIGGKSEMSKINFKLSDDQKFQAIWSLLNTEYNEECGWMVSHSICEVYDDYALTFNYENGCYERVYYTKNDELDSIELNDIVQVYVVDITSNEKTTLDTLRKLNGDTYELVNENLEKAEENANACVEFSTKIEEMTEQISTLETEKAEYAKQIEEVNELYSQSISKVSELEEENQTLNEYKYNVEKQNKESVIAEYVEKLPEEILNTYKENLDTYTVDDLDMHLAYELKKTGLFTSVTHKNGYLPKDDAPRTGVEEILSRYMK